MPPMLNTYLLLRKSRWLVAFIALLFALAFFYRALLQPNAHINSKRIGKPSSIAPTIRWCG